MPVRTVTEHGTKDKRSVAFALDEVLRASPAYRWTLNHTVAVADGLELFPTHLVDVGA